MLGGGGGAAFGLHFRMKGAQFGMRGGCVSGWEGLFGMGWTVFGIHFLYETIGLAHIATLTPFVMGGRDDLNPSTLVP